MIGELLVSCVAGATQSIVNSIYVEKTTELRVGAAILAGTVATMTVSEALTGDHPLIFRLLERKS